MAITSTILNNYVTRHLATTLPYYSSGGGSTQCSSPSVSGRKRPAGKEPTTKSWVQRTFFSTPAKALSPTAPRRQRRKSKHSTPVIVDHQREKKEIKTPVAPDRLEPTIRFTKRSVEDGAEVFKFCLVGKFPGRRPSLEQIRDWAGKEWKLRGEWSVTLLDRNHVFIRLDNEDDMVRVWPRNRWFICGKLMKVFKWVPTFTTATAGEPSSAAVWISLPSLPIVLFQEKFLYQVAGLVGKVVAMDKATRNLSRTNAARVCVEVDLAKTLPDRVRIEIGDVGFWQDVVYEKLPYYCTHCNKQGHSTDICKFRKLSDEKEDDANQDKVEDDANQDQVDSVSPPKNQSLPNVMIDLQAQTCPAILNKSGRKKRVTITDGHVYPAAADCKEKKRRAKSLEGIEEVNMQGSLSDEPSEEHKNCNGTAMAIDKGEVIGTSTKELEHSVVTGESSQMLDTEFPKKNEEIEGDADEGVDKEQESKLVVTKGKMNLTRTKTKSPNAGHRIRIKSAIFFWKRKGKRINGFQSTTTIYSSSLSVGWWRRFTFTEIQCATNNFDPYLKIGEGGFGSVYRGTLERLTVAIKRHNPCSAQGLREFEKELNLLSNLRHKNLVNLVGYCTDCGEMMLVYEFVGCGNFKELSYGSTEYSLSWSRRIGICLGAARGLRYLHENGVVHRDVKTSNILINEDYDAKISDLGLGISEIDSTTIVVGTFGYLDPEYFHARKVTRKIDVYSFGVVLFEVLCGKPAIDVSHLKNLVEWALDSLRRGNVEDIVDPHLRGFIQSDCLKKYVELATSCVSERGYERPTMEEVVNKLELAIRLDDNGRCSNNSNSNSNVGSCLSDDKIAFSEISSHGSLVVEATSSFSH